MNINMLLCIATSAFLVFSVLVANQFVSSQPENTDPSTNSFKVTSYAEAARQLLNQSKIEYHKGNTTGAEELAIRAYLDNFEYVEAPLEQKGQQKLKEEIEIMMRDDLRVLIKEKVSAQELNNHVNVTDGMLREAIDILNNPN